MVNEYMSAEAAEAASPYASPSVEGSQAWYTSEIASREAAAVANTELNPSNSPEVTYTTSFYTDPRTGEKYASESQFLSQNPTGVSVPEWTTPGVPVVTPTGETFYTHQSQYWMDPLYTGEEPSVAEKAAYSTVEYAAAFAGTLMNQYSPQQVSAPVRVIQQTYPKLPAGTPITRTIAEQVADLTGSGDTAAVDNLVTQAKDVVNSGLSWLANNLLVVVIVISAVIILPRVLPAPSGRRS